MKFDLGQKVLCNGFYQKNRGTYFDIEKNIAYQNNKKIEDVMDLEIYSLKEEKFVGFICGIKKIYKFLSCESQHPYSSTYIFKQNKIEVYEVCFVYKNRWCKRLVPIEYLN